MNAAIYKAGAALALALALVAGSYYKGRADERGKTADAKAETKLCVERGADKDAAISAQNDAIGILKREGDAKTAAAIEALKLAQKATDAGRADVARILSLRPPVGRECEAAEALIAKEMGE